MRNRYTLLLFFLFSIVADSVAQQAERVTISGTVYDKAAGGTETFPGVNIICQDAKTKKRITGTASDLEGGFSIKVPVGSDLVFSYVSYRTTTYKVRKAASGISIFLEENVNEIEETVIVGNRKVSKANATSAHTVIKADELAQTPVSNVMSLLQGRVAGMEVQLNNGLPGAQGTFNIRGISDISVVGDKDSGWDLASSAPLFVVDDIPQDDVSDYNAEGLISGSGVSPLSTIALEDIDNIQILKDAAATSLYGSKGAYGVILITTKKGNSTKPKVAYSGNFTVSTPPSLREVAIGNAERNLLKWQILNNDTSQIYHGYWDIMFMPSVSDSLNPYFNNHTDWQEQFYRVTYNHSHNLSFMGGSDLFNYKINGNYYTEKGIVKNTDFNRYALTGNMNYRSPNSKFTIGVDVKVSFTDNSTGSGNAVSQSGVASAANASSLLPPPSLYSASVDALQVFGITNSTVKSGYSATVNLGYKLPFKINWKGIFNYSYDASEQEKFTPAILADNGYRAIAYNYSGNTSKIYVSTSANRSFDLKYIGLDLTAGIRYDSRTATGNSITFTGLPNDYIVGPVGHGKSEGKATVSENQSTFSLIFNPSIKIKTKQSFRAGGDKYIVEPSISPELSSVYGTKTKWNFNPGIGLRWNIGYEDFMRPFENWLDNMNIRLTWGQVVKYKATRYDVWGTYDIKSENTYNGQSYIPIDFKKLPNAQLDPITTTTWNLGYGFSLFNGRLGATLDAYYKQVDNQLSDISLPDHSGFDKMRSTEVSLVNYGLEVALTGRPLPIQSKWNLMCGLNFAINRDVITKLPNEARQILNNDAWVANRLGANTTSMLLYINKGVYATDEDVPVNPVTGKRLKISGNNTEEAYFKAGDPIWVDVNGDYIIDEKDRVVAANARPKITGGFYFNLSYKEFSMHVNTSFVFGRDIINTVLANTLESYSNPVKKKISDLRKNAALAPIERYNFWTEDNRYNAQYPNPYNYIHNQIIDPFREEQTLFVEDGSYFKLNTVSLSYRFPKEWLSFFRVGGVTLKASVNNIWTFSKYSGISPENVTGLGRDRSGGYPNPRTWTVGVTLNL